MIKQLPKLKMLVPCNHYRYEGHKYGCAVLGECKPIQQGPNLAVCPKFSANGQRSTVSDDDMTEYCPCTRMK